MRPPTRGAVLVAAILTAPDHGWSQWDPVQRQVALESALSRYRNLASQGDWPTLSGGVRLKVGVRASSVEELRQRLSAEGYPVRVVGADRDLFDAEVHDAVRRFQELHGLEPDGIVGQATVAELNIPAQARVDQIEANLAGGRVPDSLGSRYLIVNVAGFWLDVIEGGRSVLHLRTIVGRPSWPTPTLTSPISEVIFRPRWTVPRSIATKELLPTIRRDTGYFARTATRVFQGRTEVDPATVDWPSLSPTRFPYQLVQDPGPLNPLGGVKFVLRTPYDVYLHDTPATDLFRQRRRSLSHGCVRVENADRLVAYLLPSWLPDSIVAAMATGRERRVPVPKPIPAHLVYWTVWSETDGLVAFREDIYHREARAASDPRVRRPPTPKRLRSF
jgi:L,D-transpeptidase YcbB